VTVKARCFTTTAYKEEEINDATANAGANRHLLSTLIMDWRARGGVGMAAVLSRRSYA